jgi:hypothetical protein
MNFPISRSLRSLSFLVTAIALTVLFVSPLQAEPAATRVVVVGPGLRSLASFLTKAGISAQAMDALPGDPTQLAAVADVVILQTNQNDKRDPDQEKVLENFVRAGGGLWIDSAHAPARGWLESMTAAIALDGRQEQWVALDPAPASPLADLDFKSLPRLNQGRSVAPPGSGQLELINILSPWYFSKPLWQDQWQVWITGPAPHRLPFLTMARYGAGHTAIWSAGMALTDPALVAWSSYPELCKRVIASLGAGAPASGFVPLRTVNVDGLLGPAWWSGPLDAGLKGMSQKLTVADFRVSPVALMDGGYLPIAGDDAPNAVLFGEKADAPSQAANVLRAPFLNNPSETPTFDAKSAGKGTEVSGINFVDADGKATSVQLPHSVPAPDPASLPTVGNPSDAPPVTLPSDWKIAYTQNSDSEEDAAYHKADFDDSKWKTAAAGKQSTTLFGKATGYDGAIWYRGHINVPAASIQPDASLVFQGGGQHLEVYIDGRRAAVEPKMVSLPLSEIGAGDHLIAVRTFGELRTNYGLLSVDVVRLPLLWRPDPHQEGWAGNWAKPGGDPEGWQPVSNAFANETAGREALEGWIRTSVNVPEKTVPFEIRFHLSIDVASRLFIDGVPQEAHGVERIGLYTIPGSSFHAGKNDVVFWTRFYNNQGKSLTGEVVPTQLYTYRATVHADHPGQSLQAEIQNGKTNLAPAAASIRVGGHVVGGWAGNSDGNPILLAPHALAAGDNDVEVTIAGSMDGLKSLKVCDVPDNLRLPVPGWARLPVSAAPADWYQPSTDDQKWEPVGDTTIQDWEKVWVVKPTVDLTDPKYVYRTHLVLTEQDLKKNWTLFLKGAAIRQLFVNGQPVQPDDESFYSLNRALKVGDNVLALQPDYSVYRGMDILVPTGRPRGAYMPELRTDVAALEPAQPELAGFRLNRTYPVAAWQPPADGKPLFCWPNGDPAIVQHSVNGKNEILAAPGIFDQILPGPNMYILGKQSGAVSTVSYEYAQHLKRDALQKEPYEELLPALLAYGEGQTNWITNVQSTADTAQITVRGPAGSKAQLAWRLLDWEGIYLSTGTADILFGPDGTASASVPLPDLTDGTHDEGTGLGRFVRLRANLLSADRREVLAHLDRFVVPNPTVVGCARLDTKIESFDAKNGGDERRIMHMALDELAERSVYLPGETVHVTAYLENSTAIPQTVSVNLAAVGALNAQKADQKVDVTLSAFAKKEVPLTIDSTATATEQPWSVLLEVAQNGHVISRDRRNFTVAQPRGDIMDTLEANKQGRSAGGYMWQMTPHALAIEHRLGTDALPIPGPWWAAVRFGGDGNWLVAEGTEYDSEAGLLWGPFFDQGRGEEINSFGWFPNGQSFRQWWSPYGMRELARTFGDQSVVFALSDWWQYDAGYPDNNYATFEMFNNWLAAHKGQTIAGMVIDGQPVKATTLGGMQSEIQLHYKPLFNFFLAEGLSHSAAYTGRQLEATAPGSVQLGQGSYASRLPGTEGGVTLAPEWAHYEHLGLLDADNHYFAGIYQYALETATFRALGVDNGLTTQWESPQAYHAVKDTPAAMIPMDASFWQNRLLDSRWQVIGDDKGEFQRVLNLTHMERMSDQRGADLIGGGSTAIGSGMLPAHWRINDKLSNLAMTIGVAKPLSPLLVVGESDVDWGTYYGMLGKFRDAGLNLGGAVSISELDKLKPEDVPGLVWMPAAQVSGPLLAAVQRKVEAGVPLLIIGQVPTSESSDWFKWLGINHVDDSPTDPATQEVGAAWKQSDTARGMEQTFHAPMTFPSYSVAEGGMQPIVQRTGRLLAGVVDQPQKKVVFYGLLYPLYVQDDAAVRRLAVEAFYHLKPPAVLFDDSTGGYAFHGLDGALYIVLENRQSSPRQSHVQVQSPIGTAANLLTGEKLPVASSPGGGEITVPLQADGATVVVIRP